MNKSLFQTNRRSISLNIQPITSNQFSTTCSFFQDTRKQERRKKEKPTRAKFNPELPCIRVNNSKSSFPLMTRNFILFFFQPAPLACMRRLFIFQRAILRREITRISEITIFSRVHSPVSPSLSPLCNNEKGTTYPSHCSSIRRAIRACPSRRRDVAALNISVRAR